MKIYTNKFLGILKKCVSGIDKSKIPIISGTDTFSFNNGFVHSFNNNLSVSIKLPKDMKDLNGNIKAKELFNIINKIKENEFLLTIKEKSWLIKVGSSRIELNKCELGVNDFISDNIVMENKKFKDLPKSFLTAIEYAKLTKNKSKFDGVLIKNNNVMSLDGFKINYYELESSMDSFFIGVPSINELLRYSTLEKYFVSKSWIHFLSSSNIYFSCRKLNDDGYPFDNALKLIKSHKKCDSDVSGKFPIELIKSVEMASILSSIGDDVCLVKLTITNDEIMVFSEKSTGKYTEKIKWDDENKLVGELNEPLEFYITLDVLENGIKRSPNFYIKNIDDEKYRIVFYGENCLHISGLYKKV